MNSARVKALYSRNKALWLAIVTSLILHVLLLANFTFTLPSLDDTRQSLVMRLEPMPEVKETQLEQKPPVSPPPEINVAEPEPAPASSEVTDNPEPTVVAENADNIKLSNPDVQRAEVAPVSPSNQAPVEPDNPIDNKVQEAKPAVYQHVETEFDVYSGGDKSPAGKSSISFHIDKNGEYQLKSMTEAKGLASLFFKPLIQTSEGMVTPDGLRPNHYLYQYGDDKVQRADFAWSDKVVILSSNKGERIETIAQGTQDLLSFMYQFMFNPPLDTTEITMTNGKSLRSYTYTFEGEEVVHTPLGDLKTIHLLKSSDGEEKTELWLAIDYQHLPVKIRKTEKNGNVIEQMISTMRTERLEAQEH